MSKSTGGGSGRNERRRNFTITPNDVLDDETLTLQAKALLTIMLRYPDDWRYRLSHIEKKSKNGRDAHRSALKELIHAGYAKWEYTRSGDGTMGGRELVVTDEPRFKDRGPGNPSDGGRPPGNPSDGEPDTTKTEIHQDSESSNDDSVAGLFEQVPARAKPAPKSPASPSPAPKKVHPWPEFVGAALDAWKEEAESTWAADKPTPRAMRYLKAFFEHFDKDPERASVAFRDALRWAKKNESWWRESRIVTLDEMAANNKLEGYATKAAHASSQGARGASRGGSGAAPHENLPRGSVAVLKSDWHAELGAWDPGLRHYKPCRLFYPEDSSMTTEQTIVPVEEISHVTSRNEEEAFQQDDSSLPF